MRYIIAAIFFLASCNNDSTNTELPSAEKSYIDLAELIHSDIENNSKNSCGEEKIITVNNKQEKQSVAKVDWAKEMELLLDCDINKASWKGKFHADTIWKNDTIMLSVTYSAISDKINVRSVFVQYDNYNEITNITIRKKVKSFLFSNEQQISYQPAKSFKINSHQKAFYMNDFISEVEIKFLCKI